MKIPKPLRIILGALLLSGSLAAQDIHNSLFNMSPLSLNPALTGAFEGTARIGGIYRAQDFGITDVRGYYSPSFYVDAPIIQGFRKQDWIGAGFMVYSDNAGTTRLRTTISGLSGSYHFAVDKNRNSVLTLGVQWGSVSRRFDASLAVLSDTFDEAFGGLGNPSTTDPLAMANGSNQNNPDDVETSFSDINAGLMLRSKLNDQNLLELGVSVGHITAPNYSFSGSGGGQGGGNPTDPVTRSDRPRKIVAHGRLVSQLTDVFSFEPTFLFQTTAGMSEIGVQAWGGYRINPDAKANFGLGYRVGDAGKILLGLDYKDLRAALSYDITLSDRHRINDYNGAFEIAAYYIIKVYKKPNVKPAIFCPQF